MTFSPPSHIERVLIELERAGHAAYLVGGCVRDAVLGNAPTDWDIATSALTHEIAAVFPKTALTGERYGTVTVILPECAVEVTTFRRDGEYQDSRRPESVEFVTALPDDLSRRDFTMNAMAISRTGELVDPFGGERDIMARLIRCVGDPERRFREDALRMLRALRFSAKLGFDIEPETLQAIERLAPVCAALSAERVCIEVQKTLLSPRPEIVGDMLKYGLLAGRVNDSVQNSDKFSNLRTIPPDGALRWCAFTAILQSAGYIASAPDFTRAIRLDNKTATACSTGAALALSRIPDSAAGIKRLIAKHGPVAVRCAAAAHEVLYDEPRLSTVNAVMMSGECCSVKDLAVTGDDLIAAGIPPGKQIGKKLEALLSHVIEHPEDNDRDKLLESLTVNC